MFEVDSIKFIEIDFKNLGNDLKNLWNDFKVLKLILKIRNWV